MSKVDQILENKGSQVFSIGRDATVMDAAILMNEHKIGALVVTEHGKVVGMFTERDVLRRVVGERRSPDETTINEVMTKEVVCCPLGTQISDVRTVMMQRRIRHIPVVDDDRNLIGLISIGDLNAHRTDKNEQTIHFLQEYLYGNV